MLENEKKAIDAVIVSIQSCESQEEAQPFLSAINGVIKDASEGIARELTAYAQAQLQPEQGEEVEVTEED